MAFISVFIGGGAGSFSRYLLSKFINDTANTLFPLGTFVVNIIGCFVIGFLFSAFEETLVQPERRLLLITGFLGGFTTFSSFGLETVKLLKGNDIMHAFLNVTLNVAAGLVFVVLDMLSAALLVKRK